MSKVYIGNKRSPRKKGCIPVYVGRGSPLGNPYIMANNSEKERNAVCDEYEAYLPYQLKDKLSPQYVAMQALRKKLALGHSLELICYCAPKRCHAETIKALLK